MECSKPEILFQKHVIYLAFIINVQGPNTVNITGTLGGHASHTYGNILHTLMGTSFTHLWEHLAHLREHHKNTGTTFTHLLLM